MTTKVYVDANIFIFAFEREGAISDCARALLKIIDKNEVVGVISELILAELLVKPLKEKDQELADIYAELLDAPKGLETHPVSRDILIEAARQRAIHNTTKLPDAIHIATARLNKCRAFVTADRKLELPVGLIWIGLDSSTINNIRALT
ncbi:MAG: type II toxin-antitoxin system VapC family toxin [Methylocystis sp.]|nr:type II toxin-antitoxin system VapC family toxin [Methylocystis sp.]MBI3274931.1 type II toxin-antitoxin system VapC family toxin [Methylocystis sp.]